MSGNNKHYLVSGGGTGGHIFPALSIANEIRRRYPEAEILFVGAEGRMEMERVPAAGYAIKGLPVCGFDRKHLLRNVKVLFKLWKSIRLAKKILKDFKPDIAIGVGGYASGPMLKAAQKKGIPTLLQEQNSYAGVTNKLLAKNAKCICVAYEGMERFFPEDKIVLTGNPVRRNLLECNATQEEARKAMGIDPEKATILIIGGSLGARTVNESIIGGLEKLDSACGASNENRENTRRHRVQRSAVSDALFVKHTAKFRGYVLTRPAVGLVDNQNSVCHTQRSRMIPRWARTDKIACLAPAMPPGTVAPAAAACPPPPRARQRSEAL